MPFSEIFCEPGGKFSHMRVLAVIFITLLSVAWFALSIKHWELQGIPVSLQSFVGILVGGNVLKRGVEAIEARQSSE